MINPPHILSTWASNTFSNFLKLAESLEDSISNKTTYRYNMIQDSLKGTVFLIHLFLSFTGNYKITGEEMNALAIYLPCGIPSKLLS